MYVGNEDTKTQTLITVHDSFDAELDARKEGYRAYLDGLSRDNNPYNNNDEWDLHLAWEEGFGRAAWDD